MLRAFLLIVVGLAGDPEHGELFTKWGNALADASAKVGVARDRMIYLADAKGETGKARGGKMARTVADSGRCLSPSAVRCHRGGWGTTVMILTGRAAGCAVAAIARARASACAVSVGCMSTKVGGAWFQEAQAGSSGRVSAVRSTS